MDSLIKSDTINFNELVKTSNNSILSDKLQSKMVKTLNQEFTEEEQRWYIANLYVYMHYHPTNDFPINLENVYKMIGFANKGNAMKTIKSNFVVDQDYKVVIFRTEKNLLGGRPTEDIMLNVDTFKNLCMIVKTEKGKAIRRYYVKLENIYNQLIKEEIQEREELLIREREDTKEKLLLKDQENKIHYHNTLLERLSNKKVFYIAEIETDKLIKIGSTKDISKRIIGLSRIFKTKIIFLEVFDCYNYQDVESSVLADDTIKKNRYKKSINGHVSEEVIELSDNFNYSQLLDICKKYVHTYNFLTPVELLQKRTLDIEEKKLEDEEKKIENESRRLDLIQKMLDDKINVNSIISILSAKQTYQEQQEEHQEEHQEEQQEQQQEQHQEEQHETQVSKQHFNAYYPICGRVPKGQKIHKINPNNLEDIIKTYDSMVYLLRSPECITYNKSGILNAINHNRIYKGFRWNFINRETKPTNPYKSNAPIRDPILQLNELKDTIIQTFITKDIAAKSLNITKLAMRDIVKNQIKYNSCYYIEYSKCPIELINAYDKPIFGINSVHAKRIKQINPISQEVIIFNNLNEISLKLGFASATILNAIDTKKIYGGSVWEYA